MGFKEQTTILVFILYNLHIVLHLDLFTPLFLFSLEQLCGNHWKVSCTILKPNQVRILF